MLKTLHHSFSALADIPTSICGIHLKLKSRMNFTLLACYKTSNRGLCIHSIILDQLLLGDFINISSSRLEVMQELSNLPTMELIQNDGSPSGSKLFVLWNPPLRLKMVCSVVKSYSSRVFNGKLFSTFRSSEVLLSCRSQRELRVALMMTLLTNI